MLQFTRDELVYLDQMMSEYYRHAREELAKVTGKPVKPGIVFDDFDDYEKEQEVK